MISIILEGLFVLGVASFENSINDTIRILLKNIPEKLDLKTESISKKELIYGNPLMQAIENKVNYVGRQNLSDILKYFTKIAGISNDLIDDEELNNLIEIKATRNLLIHNNLIENSFYKETAGPKIRKGEGMHRRLKIDRKYLYESLLVMRTILRKFRTELTSKYADYTRANAIKKLFEYMFPTPIMVFDNEFEIDEDKDVIGSLKRKTSQKEGLSSSERLYYDIWVAHSHSNKFEFKRGHFHSLSTNEKLFYFIEQLDLLKT